MDEIIIGQDLNEELQINLFGEFPKDDICFQHAIFAQCSLPIKSLGKEVTKFQTTHGKASLLLQSGAIQIQEHPPKYENREIPYGSIGRLIFAHINNEAIKNKTREINIFNNIHQFIQKFNLSVCATTYKQVENQMKNVSASLIQVGVWGEVEGEKRGKEAKMLISDESTMWVENDAISGKKIWQRTFSLSERYYDVLQMHKVPLSMSAVKSLAKTPRSLDLFMWLSYRLRMLKEPILIPYTDLLPIFGHGFKGPRALENFRPMFKKSLILVHKHYPEAIVDLQEKGIKIFPSLSPVNNY